MRDPRVLRLRGGFDARELTLAQVREAIGDAVDVLFDRQDHVGEYGGLPGPVMVNRFGKPTIHRAAQAMIPQIEFWLLSRF